MQSWNLDYNFLLKFLLNFFYNIIVILSQAMTWSSTDKVQYLISYFDTLKW